MSDDVKADKKEADEKSEKASEHELKLQAQDRARGKGEGPDGIDMFPPIEIKIGRKKHTLDIDDPDLPEWVSEQQFKSGDYPYSKRMKSKHYEKSLEALQLELVRMQGWLKDSGQRVIVIFEGRDAAGKGGTIERITENMNTRSARTVALPAPTEREQGQWYYQRYVNHFPTAGEIVIFDRSWYNRGVVEPVMGYCTPDEQQHFLEHTPGFERQIAADGIHLIKFWLNIGRETQIKRFHDRRHNPLKMWKLSPNDVKSLGRWNEYTEARDRMISATDIEEAPWTVVRANDKRRARINAIRFLLHTLPYEGKDKEAIGKVDTKIVGRGMEMIESM